MRLDEYRLVKLGDIYLEDIPFILNPRWAISQFEQLNEEQQNYCTRFYAGYSFSGGLLSDIQHGNAVFVKRSFYGAELLISK